MEKFRNDKTLSKSELQKYLEQNKKLSYEISLLPSNRSVSTHSIGSLFVYSKLELNLRFWPKGVVLGEWLRLNLAGLAISKRSNNEGIPKRIVIE